MTTVHIHEDCNCRYHLNDASVDFLDERGTSYYTEYEAKIAACSQGYTHYVGSNGKHRPFPPTVQKRASEIY